MESRNTTVKLGKMERYRLNKRSTGEVGRRSWHGKNSTDGNNLDDDDLRLTLFELENGSEMLISKTIFSRQKFKPLFIKILPKINVSIRILKKICIKHGIALFSSSIFYQNTLHYNAKLLNDFQNKKTAHPPTSHWKRRVLCSMGYAHCYFDQQSHPLFS